MIGLPLPLGREVEHCILLETMTVRFANRNGIIYGIWIAAGMCKAMLRSPLSNILVMEPNSHPDRMIKTLCLSPVMNQRTHFNENKPIENP